MMLIKLFVAASMMVGAFAIGDVEINPAVWDAIKYIAVLFLGVLAWQAKRFVGVVDKLNDTVSHLQTIIAVTQNEVKDIKRDMEEVKDTVRDHGKIIRELDNKK